MAYPTSIDNFTEKVDNVDDVNAQDVNELQGAVESLEAKVGVDGSSVATSHDYKISKLEAVVNNASSSAPASLDLHEDTDNGTNKITITAPSAIASDKTITLPDVTGTLALLETVYPVGSVYTNKTVSTNPATLFGFGTWTAITGRVIVGVGTSDQLFAAGTTGGESAHALTSDENAPHTHNIKNSSGAGSGFTLSFVGSTTPQDSNQPTTSSGSGTAHNNLQPYATAYVWERTA